jgi:hypothetical protein
MALQTRYQPGEIINQLMLLMGLQYIIIHHLYVMLDHLGSNLQLAGAWSSLATPVIFSSRG